MSSNNCVMYELVNININGVVKSLSIPIDSESEPPRTIARQNTPHPPLDHPLLRSAVSCPSPGSLNQSFDLIPTWVPVAEVYTIKTRSSSPNPPTSPVSCRSGRLLSESNPLDHGDTRPSTPASPGRPLVSEDQSLDFESRYSIIDYRKKIPRVINKQCTWSKYLTEEHSYFKMDVTDYGGTHDHTYHYAGEFPGQGSSELSPNESLKNVFVRPSKCILPVKDLNENLSMEKRSAPKEETSDAINNQMISIVKRFPSKRKPKVYFTITPSSSKSRPKIRSIVRSIIRRYWTRINELKKSNHTEEKPSCHGRTSSLRLRSFQNFKQGRGLKKISGILNTWPELFVCSVVISKLPQVTGPKLSVPKQPKTKRFKLWSSSQVSHWRQTIKQSRAICRLESQSAIYDVLRDVFHFNTEQLITFGNASEKMSHPSQRTDVNAHSDNDVQADQSSKRITSHAMKSTSSSTSAQFVQEDEIKLSMTGVDTSDSILTKNEMSINRDHRSTIEKLRKEMKKQEAELSQLRITDILNTI